MHRCESLVAADEQPSAYARLLKELGLENVGIRPGGGYAARRQPRGNYTMML